MQILSSKDIRSQLNLGKDPLKKLLLSFIKSLLAVGFFSSIINILMLISPIYMMQIYDRVLASANYNTLVSLTAISVFLLTFLAILEIIRNRIMARVGAYMNYLLQNTLFESIFLHNLKKKSLEGNDALRDIETIRQFLCSPTLFGFYDAPWACFFFFLVFLMHPWLGIVALIGGGVIFLLAIANDFFSRQIMMDASFYQKRSSLFLESSLRNSDVLKAMGMHENLQQSWRKNYEPSIMMQTTANDRLSFIASVSKTFRFLIQITSLGVGGYLALQNEITPGVMIASSIILGRALAPIEISIQGWRSFIQSRLAWKRLYKLIAENPPEILSNLELPKPKGDIVVEELYSAPPNSTQTILFNINATFQPGTITALIGPSGCGKTTLAQNLVGVWKAIKGNVRIDNMDITQLRPQDRFDYIGYLPQNVELFDGTIAQNIARFSEVDYDRVMNATKLVDCHHLVMHLEKHYDTEIGINGANLSAGQRQRIGLARAIYTLPSFLVLDEPNSNLDTEGEIALAKSLDYLKRTGMTIILITHNARLMTIVDNGLVLKNGTIVAHDSIDKIMQQFSKKS